MTAVVYTRDSIISRHQSPQVLSLTTSAIGFLYHSTNLETRRALHDGVNSSVTSGKQLKLLTFKEIRSISVMWNLVKAQKCYC